MRIRFSLLLALSAALATAVPGGAFAAEPVPAKAAEFVPGEVIVRYRAEVPRAERVEVQQEAGTGRAEPISERSRKVEILDGESVRDTVRELEADPSVAYAVPNYVAHASELIPNDPGDGSAIGWRALQWNFLAPFGVGAPEAWELAAGRGSPGGRGAVVALVDTGVAYENRGRLRRAPDLAGTRFTRGYDFLGSDRHPNDLNGHGTHVAGTVAQTTNNGRGLTGLAYGATLMPLRVLDEYGYGDAADIAAAIRFAARRRADVINLSLEFDHRVRARYIPDVLSAIRYARSRGSLVVGAAGNGAGTGCGTPCPVAYPAAGGGAISVGGTSHRGCLAGYSNTGSKLDIVAPGGGTDSAPGNNARDQGACRPGAAGRHIYQQTFYFGSQRRFGLPSGYEGTSMAAPHVSATAALVVGTQRLGRNPSPAALERHLKATARDLGADGFDSRYGAGLIDAAAALRP